MAVFDEVEAEIDTEAISESSEGHNVNGMMLEFSPLLRNDDDNDNDDDSDDDEEKRRKTNFR